MSDSRRERAMARRVARLLETMAAPGYEWSNHFVEKLRGLSDDELTSVVASLIGADVDRGAVALVTEERRRRGML